jgi:DNA-binding transcriptional ArsR family regulator
MPIRQDESTELGVAAKLFRGLGDPMRLEILRRLAADEMRVTDLVAAVGTSQPNVSGHLACLRECGLVVDRPEGRAVWYRLAAPEVFRVLEAAEVLLGRVGSQIELCPNDFRGGGPR